MNKSILGLAVSALFMVGAAQANTNGNDVSATLSVSGTVTNLASSCAVNTDMSSVSMKSVEVSKLKAQDASQASYDLNTVAMWISGEGCDDLASEGKLSYTFHGNADDAQGISLANTATGEGAASGVGVGLYDSMGFPIQLNASLSPSKTGFTYLGLDVVKLNGQEVVAGNVQSSLTIELNRL